jgi:hypothetical protein
MGVDVQPGVKATNYVGDIFGSLSGVPGFGPGSRYEKKEVVLAEIQVKS